MRKTTAPLLAAILAASLLFVSVPSARAASCGLSVYDQRYDRRDANSSAYGFRSPITLRRNGDLCTGGSHPATAVFDWVGIEDLTPTSPALEQIGWVHVLASPYFDGFCRFYESIFGTTDSGAQTYQCGTDTGGTVHYYKIEDVYDPISHANHYAASDCGQSDWSNCTLKDMVCSLADSRRVMARSPQNRPTPWPARTKRWVHRPTLPTSIRSRAKAPWAVAGRRRI